MDQLGDATSAALAGNGSVPLTSELPSSKEVPVNELLKSNGQFHSDKNTHFRNSPKKDHFTDDLPSLEEVVKSPITSRLLVSAKEARCLIGSGGSVIGSIRTETDTRADISKFSQGSDERILTVSGGVDDVAKALSYFAQALVNAATDAKPQFYPLFPLKQLLSVANVAGSTTVLRLLVANGHMGTLMGVRGSKIQRLQLQCNVVITASKLTLGGLNERLVEVQGAVDNLYDALRLMLRCLVEDPPAVLTPYIPSSGRRGLTGNGAGGSGPGGSGSGSGSSFGNSGGNYHSRSGPGSTPRITETVSFASDMVGALIGKNGTRIQGVCKVSGASIAIADESDHERVFTITGSQRAVEKARDLLEHNFKREERRRAEVEAEAAAAAASESSPHSDE